MTGLVAFSAPAFLRADEPQKPNREELREKLKDLTPEEREAKMKEFREKHPEAAAKRREEMEKMGKALGLNREEMEKLPPEERRAKYKEAADKKMTELQKKKTDGTITAEETELLGKLEHQKKMMKDHPGGPGGPGPKHHPKPTDEKPEDKK